jgi:hypothetical protein
MKLQIAFYNFANAPKMFRLQKLLSGFVMETISNITICIIICNHGFTFVSIHENASWLVKRLLMQNAQRKKKERPQQHSLNQWL